MLTVDIEKKLEHFQLKTTFACDDEIVVLFGPSGSGKTTVLNCISGLVNPDSGMIRVNDDLFFDGKGKSLPPQSRHIGYLFQDYALFPHMTVEKNIKYGMKPSLFTHFDQLLDVLGIAHLLHKFPHQISGGEKQRVALARALATEPSLLLLDEPLSALDRETRIQCQDELLRIHAVWKIPFVIVTHDREEAEKLGDTILFMEKGKIVAD